MFSRLFIPSKINSKNDLEKKVNVVFTDYILKQTFDNYDESMNLTDYNNAIYTTKKTLQKALPEEAKLNKNANFYVKLYEIYNAIVSTFIFLNISLLFDTISIKS